MCATTKGAGAWAGLWASAWSPHAGQLLGGCGPSGMTAGPRLDGRRERVWGGEEMQVWEPLIDKAALLVLRGPFTHIRTAWEARLTGVGSVGGLLPPTQERRGQGASWAGSLRRELRTCPQAPGKEENPGSPCSASVTALALSPLVSSSLTLNVSSNGRGVLQAWEKLRFRSRRGATLP